MKKILFVGCLLSSIVLLANVKNHDEIGGNIGLTSIYNENGLKLKNFSLGMTYQINDYIIKPRFDLDYVKIDDFDDVNSLVKGSLNGVYEHHTGTELSPYLLGGIGYEYVDGTSNKAFENNAFIQGVAGFAYDVGNGIKAKLEGKLFQVLGGNGQDNEVIVTAGVTFPLNNPIERVIPKVEIDVNTCPKKIIEPDEDRDGISDILDQCPHTPCDFTVDGYGCTINATLHINFGVNSSLITEYSMPKVVIFANFLKQSKGSTVKIIGHTDSDGNAVSNLSLSKRRAASVVKALVELGISSGRLTSEGYGETQPTATNSTTEGKSENRRIEAKLSYSNERRR